jgi:hypothetical protein
VAALITMYFYWLILQKCNFNKVQLELPEDGPKGPKREGANIKIFSLQVLTFLCLIKSAFVGKKNFEPYQNARYNNKN